MIWTDPQSIDLDQAEAEAQAAGPPLRVQFSRSATCTQDIFARLDQCCHRFGTRIEVRFFGFYNEEFDVEILRSLPSVRVLYIDVRRARRLEFLGHLDHLVELQIGVRDGDYPEILREPGIQTVRRLVLLDSRRNNIDLEPLSSFSNLTELTICGHWRHIEVLGHLTNVRRLALNQMSKSVQFSWIRSMKGLRDLTVFLGSRTNLDEISHGNLERLRFDRVRGLERVDLARFPELAHFHMEDQLRVQSLDLVPLSSSLRSITVWNCKSFERLVGIETMKILESLWIGGTKVQPEELVTQLPGCVRQATLTGFGKKRDDSIKSQLESLGIVCAAYTG
jgi:protein phosphatase 1 regulatory subunit 7